jgi:uncharacterized protein
VNKLKNFHLNICKLYFGTTKENMSKNSSKQPASSSSSSISGNISSQNDSNKAAFVNKSGELCINVRAKPGSKENAIVDVLDDAISIKIAAPPVDGEANKELISYVAELLNIKSRDVVLDKVRTLITV